MRTFPPQHQASPQRVSVRDLSRCSTHEARSFVPFERAGELHALPLGFLEHYGTKVLSVAVRAKSPELIQKLKFITGCEVRLVEVDEESLAKAIFIAYHADAKGIERAVEKIAEQVSEGRVDSTKLFGLRAADNPENELLCAIIDYAVSVEASDIHFQPKEKGGFVQLRVGAGFHSRETRMCSHEAYKKIVQRLKVLSKLDITIHERPQDGSFIVPLLHGSIAARVSVMPTHFGEKVVVRLLSRDRSLSLSSLSYPPTVLSHLDEAMRCGSGLTLFCGATGSGKTTSLYAVMQALSVQKLSIVSIEDPIECVFDWMDQTPLSGAQGLSSSEALRALMRQDPDVIMVGEIRDEQTAQTAVRAAMTGHRIFSSLHAGNISQAILRLESLGITIESLAATLNLIVHQELIPKLCSSCRCLDLEAYKRLGTQTYKSPGCAHCDGTGFTGRVPLVHSLCIGSDEELRASLRLGHKLKDLPQEKAYFQRLESGQYLLRQGLISLAQFENLSEQ